MESPKIRRALISVSNKTGIVEFAKRLIEAEIEIVSTGGTQRHLQDAGIPVTDVSDYTQFPEMMDGRVKTLHPKIFAGVLCRHNLISDMSIIAEHDIQPFELVVVNLYPFAETIAKPDTTTAEAVEQIDIGGPSLIRAAAKNSDFVSIVCDSSNYNRVAEQIAETGCTTPDLRKELMAAAFVHTAEYDKTIANYFSDEVDQDRFPTTLNVSLKKKTDLRYGENSHLDAALYAAENNGDANLINAQQLNGRRLSYNNLLDLDSALAIVRGLETPACSVIKHNNPCGAASAKALHQACEQAFAGDPVSAFGSVVGFNRTVDVETVEFMAKGDTFVEAIVAPGFEPEALKILTTKPKWKKNVRLLAVGDLSPAKPTWELRQLNGGMLVQDADNGSNHSEGWKVATVDSIDDDTMDELKFGWHMVRFVKSNAITLSNNRALVGVGAGQMSRVDSVELAIKKAGDRAKGSILASDAFFPFADSIEYAAAAGIKAIIQPGGSVRDEEVIEACNQHNIPMVLTARRHFRH